MLAIVAPGQGAQTPGFLSGWIEDSTSRELLMQWSDLIEIDLLRLGTTADADIEELKANPPEKVRIIPLQVSGAFHTSVMAPAVAALEALIPSLTLGLPTIPTISNKDGAVVDDSAETLRRIVGQVAGPVRWDLCMQTMAERGVTGVLEVAPGGTLTGLVKRAHPTIAQFAVKSPADIEAAQSFIAEHGGQS